MITIPTPDTSPINLTGQSGGVITGHSITGAGAATVLIHLTNCDNIHITRCFFQNSLERGIRLDNCHNITIDYCYFENLVKGIEAYQCTGFVDSQWNLGKNMVDPTLTTTKRGNFIMYNRCTGAGHRINNNRCENEPNAGNGDAINFYMCDFDISDPGQIKNNWIRGGGTNYTYGPAGIIGGDVGGSNQIIEDNICVNTGYAGIQVQGGTNIICRYNKILCTDGTTYSGLGLGCANFSGVPSGTGDIIGYNHVKWWSGRLVPPGRRDIVYKPANSNTLPADWSTNVSDETLDESILPVDMLFWEVDVPPPDPDPDPIPPVVPPADPGSFNLMRGNLLVKNIKATGEQSKKIMGENIVTCNFVLSEMLNFYLDEYADIYGERYQLNTLPDIKKDSSNRFAYTMVLQAISYSLAKVDYLIQDQDANYTIADFTLMGNAETFIDVLIANGNRVQSGWTKGTIDVTDFKEISFNNQTCLAVLATIATEFDLEYWIDGQIIHMTKRGEIEAFSLAYGKGNGLYDITRKQSTAKSIFTRLYAYGSTKNLPSDYKGYSDRLKLPGSTPYIENNVYIDNDPENEPLYGVIENSFTFDDIYPHRTGLITTLGPDIFTFIDSAIDFDVNTYLLPGSKATIVFNTGDLAGYQFTINSFDYAAKKFVINAYSDDKDLILPNTDLKPTVGDQYVIVNIKMPQSYIDAAEAELLARATAFLSENSKPIVSYAITCDQFNFKTRNLSLVLGNYVRFVDADFNLNDYIRIIAFTRDLQIPTKYNSMEIAEIVSISAIVRNYVDKENLANHVERIGRGVTRAYDNALQARATADGVKLITDYWGVTIDPDHGIIASGTLLVGAGAIGNAGITGVVDNIDTSDPLIEVDRSVRIWAGADYEHKDTAPFRVTDDGKLWASAGKIGNWNITSQGLKNDSTLDAYINQVKRDGSNNIIAQAFVGTDGSGALQAIGIFINDKITTTEGNQAIYCRASGSTVNNTAAEFVGDVFFSAGKIIASGHEGINHLALNYTFRGDDFFIDVRNGLITAQGPV